MQEYHFCARASVPINAKAEHAVQKTASASTGFDMDIDK
jgi:hypothetical protein